MYFIKKNDKLLGPFSLDKLKTMLAEGKLQQDQLVSSDKVSWHTVGEMPELFPQTEMPAREKPPVEVNRELSFSEIEPQIDIPPPPPKIPADLATPVPPPEEPAAAVKEEDQIDKPDSANMDNLSNIKNEKKKSSPIPWLVGAALIMLVIFNPFKQSKTSGATHINQTLLSYKNIHNQRKIDSLEDLSWYIQSIKSVDASKCPEDFRVSYLRHCQAWEGLYLQLRSEPQSDLEAFLTGLVHGLEGDMTGGLAQMIESRKRHAGNVQKTWNEVEIIAVRYGAK